MREQSVLVNDAIAHPAHTLGFIGATVCEKDQSNVLKQRGTGLNTIAWDKSHSVILIMIYC